MTETKRKLRGIADLYSIEDARGRQAPSESKVKEAASHVSDEDVSQRDVFRENTSPQNPPVQAKQPTAVKPAPVSHPKRNHGLARPSTDKAGQDVSAQDVSAQTTSVVPDSGIDASRGYFPVFNDLSDRVIPEKKLNAFEQSILHRMYRLSRGWKSEECEVSHGELVRACNISKSQVRRTLAGLAEKGLVVNLGRSSSGPERNRYKVLPGVPVMPSQDTSRQNASRQASNMAPRSTVSGQDASQGSTNKNSNKDLINTDTQAVGGVRAGSRFSLEECRAYAESLRAEGIQNPGGYATAIHRSGEADERVGAFLSQRTTKTERPELSAEQIQEQANVVVSMLQHGSPIEDVERLLASNFRPAQWRMIRSIALAQASVTTPSVKKSEK